MSDLSMSMFADFASFEAAQKEDAVAVHGTLRNVYRIPRGLDVRAPCLSGEVYGDTKGRFRDGERITTSTIMSEECDVFRTRYSVYRVESWREVAA
ncbi:hypothetical protein [Mesorhizobium sp. LSHC414A00]|uniref:hypothetical protein n=1 Tax=Mesorhizobium sp. LSHC414A00 TaxID=1287287 RepID=UPI0012EBFE43|nr:hypothetical protein [Mesorhizobium sp. LSHC414A00]